MRQPRLQAEARRRATVAGAGIEAGAVAFAEAAPASIAAVKSSAAPIAEMVKDQVQLRVEFADVAAELLEAPRDLSVRAVAVENVEQSGCSLRPSHRMIGRTPASSASRSLFAREIEPFIFQSDTDRSDTPSWSLIQRPVQGQRASASRRARRRVGGSAIRSAP